jgi:hypothetical protein
METLLTLLADASGSTPGVGTVVPTPWIYEYAWPISCLKARFVPHNPFGVNTPIPPGNIIAPDSNLPFVGGPQASPLTGQRNHPARFLVATDYNYAPPAGQVTWDVQGVSPNGRTVILTNVRCAKLVYTALILYPSLWDPLFTEAMVAYLASQTALAIWSKKDRKFGLEVRAQQIAIAKEKITAARVMDGNEGWFSSDIHVDWMEFRRSAGRFGYGGRGGWGEDGIGVLGYGWDALSFGDGGTAY